MGSFESESKSASSDGPVPLCVAYTNRCLAKERRNGWRSASRTSRRPEAATKHSAVGKFGQIINIGAGFGSANRIKTFQRKAQSIHSDVAAQRNLGWLDASPFVPATTSLPLVHRPSIHRLLEGLVAEARQANW